MLPIVQKMNAFVKDKMSCLIYICDRIIRIQEPEVSRRRLKAMAGQGIQKK
jgi:hypothetical protein